MILVVRAGMGTCIAYPIGGGTDIKGRECYSWWWRRRGSCWGTSEERCEACYGSGVGEHGGSGLQGLATGLVGAYVIGAVGANGPWRCTTRLAGEGGTKQATQDVEAEA